MLFDLESTKKAAEEAFPEADWVGAKIHEKTWAYTTNRWLLHATFPLSIDPDGFYCFQLTDEGSIRRPKFFRLWERDLADSYLKGDNS